MPFELMKSDVLDETVHRARLDCGLEVLIWPKPGFNKKYAVFATRFGSTHNRFVLPGGDGEICIPDGIAHFLEHKLFEDVEGDAFDKFARLGASANAMTSFTSTWYLFSCTDRFDESLKTLLDFVQVPYFTVDAVEKERGIITQEIRMYEDHPDWQAFFGLLGAMFQKHPVRIDIAGTAASIRAIDVNILHKVYDAFYHPGNMVVFAAGDLDPERVLDQVARNLDLHERTARRRVECIFPDEPEAVGQPLVVKRMAVSRPKVHIGFKEIVRVNEPQALMRTGIVTNLLLDVLLGKSSKLYSSLYSEGVIDDSFSASFTGEADHGYTIIGGETEEPERFVAAVTEGLARAAASGIDERELDQKRRKQVGHFLRNFDAPDTGGSTLLHYYLRNQDVFAYLDILNSVTAEELAARLADHFVPARMTVSSIMPLEGSGRKT